MDTLTEPEPVRAAATEVAPELAPGIRRIVANNPGRMTYWGTNTYVIDGPDGLIVLDPGPAGDAAHLAALLALGPIRHILLSHGHSDHRGLVQVLQARTGAVLHAYGPVQDGDAPAGWTALHTPGHAADHLCFTRGGVVFSGDHVMGWSTTVISPPDGDMAAYMASLSRMVAREDRVFLPGHGPPILAPARFARAMLNHRLLREQLIADRLGPVPIPAAALTRALYAGVSPALWPAAERTVVAHLEKLAADGRARTVADGWVAT